MSVSKHRAMRIGFVSHFPASVLEQAGGARECCVLCQYALALGRQGGLTFWLCSPATLEALATQVSLIPTGATDVPVTCRHVVPLRPYRLEGIRLFCIDRDLWRQRDRHSVCLRCWSCSSENCRVRSCTPGGRFRWPM